MYDLFGYDGSGTGFEPLDGQDGALDDAASLAMDPNYTWNPGDGEGLLQKWEREQAWQSRIDEYNKWSPEFMQFLLDYLNTVRDGEEMRKVTQDAEQNETIDLVATERARVEDARNGEYDAFYEKYGREFDQDQFDFTWDYDKIFGVDENGELIPPRQGFVEIGPTWVEDGLPPEWREEDGGTVEFGPVTVEEPQPSGGGSGATGSGGSSGGGFGATWGGGGGEGPSVHVGPSWVSEDTGEDVPD